MKKKLLAMLGVTVLLVSSLAGCSSGSTTSETAAPAAEETTAEESTESADCQKTIAFVPKQLGNPYFAAVQDAVEAAAEENGFLFETSAPDSSVDIDKQISICDAYVSKGVDVLILIANDSTALKDVTDKAMEKGIAVFTVDSGVDGDNYVSYIGTDNYAGGQMAAQWMGENVKGQVAVIDGAGGNKATTDRFNGFMDKIKDYPDIEVVTSDYGNGDMATSMTVAENFITAYPDLAGIFTCDDIMAQGAGQAIQAAGKKDQVTICGFDGSPDGAQAIIDGLIDATIAQTPANMGKTAVEEAVKYLNGEDVEKTINTPIEVVYADNAEDYLNWH